VLALIIQITKIKIIHQETKTYSINNRFSGAGHPSTERYTLADQSSRVLIYQSISRASALPQTN
ncbi:MAG: hypothetical protein WA963_04465, partial [Bermanella sp.]